MASSVVIQEFMSDSPSSGGTFIVPSADICGTRIANLLEDCYRGKPATSELVDWLLEDEIRERYALREGQVVPPFTLAKVIHVDVAEY